MRRSFIDGLTAGIRPFLAVLPGLLRAMGVSVAMMLGGAGMLVLGRGMEPPISLLLILLGEGLMIGAGLLGGVASVRAWLALFRAAGIGGKEASSME